MNATLAIYCVSEGDKIEVWLVSTVGTVFASEAVEATNSLGIEGQGIFRGRVANMSNNMTLLLIVATGCVSWNGIQVFVKLLILAFA